MVVGVTPGFASGSGAKGGGISRGSSKRFSLVLIGAVLCSLSGESRALTLFREQLRVGAGNQVTAIAGADDAAPETLPGTSSFTNSSDGSSGSWTATAKTTGGATPKAEVGVRVTNQVGNGFDVGKLYDGRAVVTYEVSIFATGAFPIPPGVLVPIVVRSLGSASVAIDDPSLASLGVTGLLQVTLPDPANGNAPAFTPSIVGQASVGCSGGFPFCLTSDYTEGFVDEFEYSAVLDYPENSVVSVQLLAFTSMGIATGNQTASLAANVDPLIYIDPTATFTDGNGSQTLFRDAFELVFSEGILPGVLDGDGDGVLDFEDNCPAWANPGQADANQNGIGNDCECGDQTGDGLVDVRDLVAINVAIFNPGLVSPLCDANNDGLCNVSDIVQANLKIYGQPAYCSRYPPPAP